LVWLIAASFSLFGVNLVALRLVRSGNPDALLARQSWAASPGESA
jgi:hypothetical protein